MSNESHPSPTGSSSSSLFGGGGNASGGNMTTVSGPSPYPSPSKPTWAQILNSNANTPSNASASSSSAVTASTNPATSGPNTVNTVGHSPPSSSSPSSSSQQSNNPIGTSHVQTSSISSTEVPPSTSSAFNFPGRRTGFLPHFYDQSQTQQQQQSQMNWPLNFNQSPAWMVDDDTQRHSNLVGSSSQQSFDSKHHTAGGGDGFDRFDSSSPTPDWGKPVTSNNSTANGWSNFQPQQNVNNPSRSNTIGNNNNNNASSNQWPEMNNFYGATSSTGNTFNLPQSNNDTLTSNSASNTWQDSPLPGNTNEPLPLTSGSSTTGSVINKHKSSSTSSIAASLNVALKSAIALGGANVDSPAGGPGGDSTIPYVPQPRLVEQLGWDEPEIKIAKRGNFDDGTSIWGDPMESAAVAVKKWTNGSKAALTNSTNTVAQPSQSAIVQKPVAGTTGQGSNLTPTSSQIGLNDENWPKQQSPTLVSQSSSQWSDVGASNDQMSSGGAPQKPTNYRSQQSTGSNWNAQSQQSAHGISDDWLGDGVVDTTDWALPSVQNKVPFNPDDGKVDTSDWIVPGGGGGGGGGMGGPLQMSAMNRNRFMNDYEMSESSHDPPGVHRMPGYDNSSMNESYRQGGGDLKNPIMGLGGLLPSSGNSSLPPHMMPPSQLPFGARPGPMYPSSGILRPINPNGVPTQSGAIMGTGGLISPKLSTTSPVPNQAPYVPLTAKHNNMPGQASQTPTPQQQQQGAAGGLNNGAVHAQIMQQFRLAVQAGLISQDLLNTKLPPYMLQLLQKLFELQQKYQAVSIQLNDFSKHKQRFPITFFQTEYERLSKLLTQRKQDMLIVQKQIQDAHNKLKQQQSATSTPTPSQMMVNGPASSGQGPSGGSSGQSQDQLADRMQHALAVDQSRLHQWTKQSSGRSGQSSSSSMFAPPGLTQKDWQNSNNNPNDNWENASSNEPTNNNQGGTMDSHGHNNQTASSAFHDQLADFVDDTEGPPPFVPGQLWNWKSPLTNAEDDPHATPTSLPMGSKGPSSSMNNLNVGGGDSAFSNPQMLHHMQRQQQQQQQQQSNRSQWQSSFNDSQGFQPSMHDWNKPNQYRGTSKQSPSLTHPPPPPHTGFGGYRPYM